MDLDEYRRLYGDRDDAAPGWDAILARLGEVYPGQNPRHWGTLISYQLGGPDPLDGVSAYECPDGGIPHLHFGTFGFTSLYYDEEAVGGDLSGFGFELTFRLAGPPPADETEPMWVTVLFQNLARHIFDTGRRFAPGHWIDAGGPIDPESTSELVGLAVAPDPTLGALDTPHGRVEFLQLVGLTAGELQAIRSKARTCREVLDAMRPANPLLFTDLSRRDG